jgi:hypothetical protein
MNYQKKVKSLKGTEMPKSFPNKEEVDKLPKIKIDKVEQPDYDKLERETVGNIILNCLANYICKDKKEGFYINLIAESILKSDGKDVELKDKIKAFLIKLLEESMIKEEIVKDKDGNETKKRVGIYSGWGISQCLQELGVEVED